MSEARIEPPTEDQRERDIRALAQGIYASNVAAVVTVIDARRTAAHAFAAAEEFFAAVDARDAARKVGAK